MAAKYKAEILLDKPLILIQMESLIPIVTSSKKLIYAFSSVTSQIFARKSNMRRLQPRSQGPLLPVPRSERETLLGTGRRGPWDEVGEGCLCKMRLTTRLLRFVTFVHLPFFVRSLDLFVASLVFMKGTSCCVIKRNF